jgi:hypothetical protein
VDRTNLINTCTIDTVKSIWNTNKFGLVSWYTHGDITDAEAIMDTNHVHLLNKEYPSFVFQGSCSNGYPEDKCNLGYYLLLNQAVGTISASRQSYFDPMRNSGYLIQQYSTNYERDVYNEWIILFSKFIMENMSIGNVLKNLRSTSSFKISQELLNIFSFNLYGDPSLRIKSTIQPISIKQGWNMISSYLIPDRDSMCSVLWGIHNNLKFVKDITDSCCKPDSINHIWNCNKAYHFYMYAPDTLYFAGTKINPTLDTIHLKSGWNWVSYLRDTPKSIDTCLNNIKNILTIAKTEDGKMYVPQYSINQIGNMVPGQGYYLSVTGNVNLVYPADSNSYFLYRETVEDKLTPLAQKIKPAITNTGNNCTLIVDSTNIPDGFEIGIIDNDGDIIGSGSVFNGKCAITIWGIDKVNQNMGSEQNEILKIFALDTALNHIYDLKLNSLRDIINGNLYNDLNYQENNIYLTSAIIDLITNDSAKISCRPNPLNESTEIEYTIPFDTMVLLSISSINGEVINSFELGYQSMGKNHYIIDCSKLPEGIYNIFLSFNKTTISTRILIIS